MKQNQKGFVNIVLVVLVVVLLGVVVYFSMIKTIPFAQESAQTNTLPVSSNSNPASVEKPLKIFGPLLLVDSFEGYSASKLEFSYPEDTFSIQASSDNSTITIKDLSTGKIDTISISNESGRGYSSTDYWNETLKKTCSSCVQIDNPISIKDSKEMMTFSNENKEWIIFGSPFGTPWLFVADIQKPSVAVEKILSTFKFTQVK